MSKVGNQTNSQDPQAVNSRTFAGNLNTFQCTKTDVERMFQRYGRIAGISMHKGYAFVQFTNPFDARSACMGEDGRSVFGQILDPSVVAELANNRNNLGPQQQVAQSQYMPSAPHLMYQGTPSNTMLNPYQQQQQQQQHQAMAAAAHAAAGGAQQNIAPPQAYHGYQGQHQSNQKRFEKSSQSWQRRKANRYKGQSYSPAKDIAGGQYGSQYRDVNLVAEPKPHQIGRKRPNVAKTSADWEQFYDSYNTCAAALGAQAGARLTPPLKRPRLVVPSVRQQTRAPSPKKIVIPGIDDLKTYSSPDILICGNCRELFSSLADFIDHRRTYCKLRFTCKCSSPQVSGGATSREQESASLMCALCKEGFASAWDLMVHAQAAHMVNIYQLASKEQSQESAGCSTAGESTAGSTAGSDVASEMVADHDGDTSNADDATPDMPKENGLNGDDLDGSDMMNGASPNPTVMETSMGMVTQ